MAAGKGQHVWKSGVQLDGVSDPMNAAMYIKSILESLQRGTMAVRLVTVS